MNQDALTSLTSQLEMYKSPTIYSSLHLYNGKQSLKRSIERQLNFDTNASLAWKNKYLRCMIPLHLYPSLK